MLQMLRKSGVLRTEGRMVHVEDWPRLAAIAEFDPEYLLLRRPPSALAA